MANICRSMCNKPSFSGITCQAPKVPDGATIFGGDKTNYYLNDRILYVCASGYQQSGGNSAVTCSHDGSWSEEFIVCSGIMKRM